MTITQWGYFKGNLEHYIFILMQGLSSLLWDYVLYLFGSMNFLGPVWKVVSVKSYDKILSPINSIIEYNQ